ncbi:hypothetical protein BU15DRAFT_74963, partial [Melanogaster broomeanus]
MFAILDIAHSRGSETPESSRTHPEIQPPFLAEQARAFSCDSCIHITHGYPLANYLDRANVLADVDRRIHLLELAYWYLSTAFTTIDIFHSSQRTCGGYILYNIHPHASPPVNGLKGLLNDDLFEREGQAAPTRSLRASPPSPPHLGPSLTQPRPSHECDLGDFHPLTSTSTLARSSSPASSGSPKRLLPGIRVPTHTHPYWHGQDHTPSSSSQSSLESPATFLDGSWLSGGANNPRDSSSTGPETSTIASAPSSSAGPSSSTHSLIEGRSSPNPHFPPPPSTNPPPNLSTRPKLINPSKSTHSLRAPVEGFYGTQLSPIVEQDYFSPEKRPLSLPSSSHEGTSGAGSRVSTAHTARTSVAMATPVSPGSDGATVTPMHTPVTPSYSGGVIPFARRREDDGGDSPRPSPVFSTFISRPLNRSISLSSTRTHQSSASSTTPPVIPPLDLKPEFRGQMFLTTPTSLNSRGFLDVGIAGADDDDALSDRRESFVTARTGAGRESKYSVGPEGDVFVDAEEGTQRDSGGTIHESDHHVAQDSHQDTPPTPHPYPLPHDGSKTLKPPLPAYPIPDPRSFSSTSSSPPSYNYPPGPHSSDYHLHPHRHTSHNHSSHPGVSAPSLQYLGSSISASSSFVDRRFAPSSLYLTSAAERQSTRKAGARWTLRTERVDAVQ